jgi:hypothetical protein
VLADQQCAAALMWTCVTIIYLIPAAILTNQLLGVRHSRSERLVVSATEQRFRDGKVRI